MRERARGAQSQGILPRPWPLALSLQAAAQQRQKEQSVISFAMPRCLDRRRPSAEAESGESCELQKTSFPSALPCQSLRPEEAAYAPAFHLRGAVTAESAADVATADGADP